MLIKEDLEQYGKVEICEEKHNYYHILITDGFSSNARNTFQCMSYIDKIIGHEYNVIDKCVTDENHFEYILKK